MEPENAHRDSIANLELNITPDLVNNPGTTSFTSLRNLCKIIRDTNNVGSEEFSQVSSTCAHGVSEVSTANPSLTGEMLDEEMDVKPPIGIFSEPVCTVIEPRSLKLATFLNSNVDDSSCSSKVHNLIPSNLESSSNIIPETTLQDTKDTQPFDSLYEIVRRERLSREEFSQMDSELTEQDTLELLSLRQIANKFMPRNDTKKKWSMRISGPSKANRACNECGHKAKTFHDLMKHMKYKHGPSMYICPVDGCDFTTKYPNNIKHHQTIHTQIRPHQCEHCQRCFKRKNQLATHILSHSDDRPFACNQCDFTTKRAWVLTQHLTVKHTDLRPFECDECGFKMKTRSDLNKHRVTHNKDKNFKCPDCGKPFKHRTRLLAHQRNQHSNLTLLPCPEKNCKRKFKIKSARKKHIDVVHKGIRKFSCDVCKRTFSTKSNLETHMVTHDSTDRPFKCQICPYSAKEDAHLRTHVGKMHALQMPGFPCGVCQISFTIKARLMQHLTTFKHQRNARFHLPPQDIELKPNITEIPIDKPGFEYVGTAVGELMENVVIKQEVDVEHDSAE